METHRMRRLLTVLSILVFLPFMGQAAPKTAGAASSIKKAPSSTLDLKSFREWKSEKIKAVQEQVDHLGAQIRAHKADSSPLARDLEQQLSQEQWNLDVARDLSVTDYLVLYLAQKGSVAQLTEAARKLSPEETAQILEAYLRSVGTSMTTQTLTPEAALIGH